MLSRLSELGALFSHSLRSGERCCPISQTSSLINPFTYAYMAEEDLKGLHSVNPISSQAIKCDVEYTGYPYHCNARSFGDGDSCCSAKRSHFYTTLYYFVMSLCKYSTIY